MPIKPENKSRYPKNWKEIRQRILQRANNRCEFCGVENHTYRYNPKTGKDAYIVLTIAHLDHTPENCSDDNLKALCQRCHNQYDAEHRKQTRKRQQCRNTMKFKQNENIRKNIGTGRVYATRFLYNERGFGYSSILRRCNFWYYNQCSSIYNVQSYKTITYERNRNMVSKG